MCVGGGRGGGGGDDLLSSISKVMERDLLSSFNSSAYFSLMADESKNVSSKEELSICAR